MAAERPTAVADLGSGRVEFRWEPRGPETVVIMHGGHMRAGLALGEEVFADAGYSVLVPSRPGYGRTPVATGVTPWGYADVTRSLCDHLGIKRVAAVVGVSAGGPSAVAFAARCPALVRRVVLLSAVGPLPWPDRRTRLGGSVLFAPGIERATWAAVHTLVRRAPELGLRLLSGSLSTLPVRTVLANLDPRHRAQLIDLFLAMRSGAGFRNDLRAGPDLTGQVTQPTLVIATRRDGGVPFAHASALAAAIPHARLQESHAHSHFLWFGPGWSDVADGIRSFLAED